MSFKLMYGSPDDWAASIWGSWAGGPVFIFSDRLSGRDTSYTDGRPDTNLCETLMSDNP